MNPFLAIIYGFVVFAIADTLHMLYEHVQDRKKGPPSRLREGGIGQPTKPEKCIYWDGTD